MPPRAGGCGQQLGVPQPLPSRPSLKGACGSVSCPRKPRSQEPCRLGGSEGHLEEGRWEEVGVGWGADSGAPLLSRPEESQRLFLAQIKPSPVCRGSSLTTQPSGPLRRAPAGLQPALGVRLPPQLHGDVPLSPEVPRPETVPERSQQSTPTPDLSEKGGMPREDEAHAHRHRV